MTVPVISDNVYRVIPYHDIDIIPIYHPALLIDDFIDLL